MTADHPRDGATGASPRAARANVGRWAVWLPVVASAILIGIAGSRSNQVRYEPHYVLPMLNAIFLTLASLLIALLAARTFLAGGSSALLPMGGGMLCIGLAGIFSGMALTAGRIDAGVIIYNAACCLAGFGQLLGAVLLIAPVRHNRPRRAMTILLASYTAAGLAIVLLTWGALAGVIPSFFREGTGPTALRQFVLRAAIIEFAGASLVVLVASYKAPSAFFRWYGLGLLLITLGLVGVGLPHVIGSTLTWAGRAAQYAGGVYLLVAVAIALRESQGWRIPLELLEETHQRYRSLVELCPDPILVHRDGVWIFANPAAAALFGAASPQDLVGRKVLDGVAPDERAIVQERIRHAYEQRGSTPLRETKLVRLDGQPVMVDLAGVRVEYEGRPAVQVVMRDVTERKRAEQALRESEQTLKSLAENVPSVLMRFNRKLRMVYLSPQAEAATGKPVASFLGKTNREAGMPEELCVPCDSAVEHVFRTAEPRSLELSFEGPRGMRTYYLKLAPEKAGGSVSHVLGVATDITDRKRMETELREASAAKDRFIASLSHELRTPLTPVVASVSALAGDPRLPEDMREDMAVVQRNIGLEVHLINDLLDVTRIVNGKLELRKQPVELAAVLREAGQIVAADLDAKGQTLTIETPGAPHWVDADRARLHQVFWNLLKNAIKFSPQRGQIRMEAAAANGSVRVVVKDSGQGIDPADLPHLFRAFEQGTAGRSFGGLGLGLAICRGVVELHGGSITAASEGKGRGATFTIELTMLPDAPDTAAPAAGREPTARRERLRILLVEDHEDTARVMSRLLRAEEHEVEWAGSVKEALAAAQAGTFDVLVSDLGLPDGTGYDLMRQLAAGGRQLKGIAVSGFGSQEDVEQSLAAGFCDHITKPVSFAALHNALIRVASEAGEGGPVVSEGTPSSG